MSARGYGSLVGEETDDGTAESARPTPTVNGNNNFVGAGEKSGDGLGTAVLKKMGEFAPRVTSEKVKARLSARARPSPQAHDHMATSGAVHGWEKAGIGKQTNLNDVVVRMARNQVVGSAWPTPTAHASHTIGNEKSRDGLNYAVERGEGKRKKYPTALTWSTPTAEDAFGSGFGKGHRPLNRQAKSFGSARPTPTCTDVKYAIKGNTQRATCLGAMARRGELERFDTPTTRGDGGSGRKGNLPVYAQLNPDWVEWLMNWPVGWTDPDAVALLMFGPSDDPADLDETDRLFIPRVTTRREFRIKRIVTLGNGQVPLCALAAELWGLAVLDPTI